MHRTRHILTAALFAAAPLFMLAQAQSSYYIGNSLTDDIDYAGVAAMFEQEALPYTWGRHMIPGAPLEWLWSNQTSGFGEPSFPPVALPTISWDNLSLQVCARHIVHDSTAIRNFTNLALQGNPAVKVYIYVVWPEHRVGDYQTQWERTYTGGWDGSNCTADYHYKLLAAVRKGMPEVSFVGLIPVGFVLCELDKRSKDGQVPGLASAYSLYVGGEGDQVHLNKRGEYAAGLTAFVTQTGIDPRGKPVPSNYRGDGLLTDVQAAAIQSAVWDVVNAMAAQTGVGTPTRARENFSVRTGAIGRANGQSVSRFFDLSGRNRDAQAPVAACRGSSGCMIAVTAAKAVRAMNLVKAAGR